MTLFIDVENKKLVQSLTSDRSVPAPVFMQGDNEPLEIFLLQKGGESLYEVKPLAVGTDFLRVGEICGLKDSDFNFETQTLNVSRTLQRVYKKDLNGIGKSKLIETSPKSRTSTREIPLSQILLPIFNRFNVMGSTNYFLSGTEKCIEVRTYRSFFENFLIQNNIEKFNFHSLRHTFATRCIEAGADCKTVSEILGHATVNMTLNLYVHPKWNKKDDV